MNRRLRLAATALAMAAGALAPATPSHASGETAAEPCPQGAACLYSEPGFAGTVQILRFDSQPLECVALDGPALSGINNTPYYLSFYDAPACSGSGHFVLMPSGHGDSNFPAPMVAFF